MTTSPVVSYLMYVVALNDKHLFSVNLKRVLNVLNNSIDTGV